MMEEVAKNENLSPEEKEQALEQLAEIREQIIEQNIKKPRINPRFFLFTLH